MQFFYHKDAGLHQIMLDSRDSHYLFRVRRFKENGILKVRNLHDDTLYFYKHTKKSNFILESLLQDSNQFTKDSQELHLIVAMIDTKDIYDTLSMLNALNVSSLNLFYADYSQKNRKIDLQKAQKILYYSCMQCGRSNFMSINIFSDLSDVFCAFEKACYIDFARESFTITKIPLYNNHSLQDTAICSYQPLMLESLPANLLQECAKNGIIIGAEGGFSPRERAEIFSNKTCYSLSTSHILTAHLTSIYIASLCMAKL
ncbi:rRNA methyltransferase [Helicobacter didelphidarum]|uniref:Ribosomal RNA small subunit methyltransferase E n=1 Tax=Helicobacter didelphidarum TaxID=2040648 RepID=A0A3D8IRN2_9HELI|nr:RsmE family RNA methyltransferase [Helicobacter didelphidarum]RDU67640.1 rRNA methyltransferase [Helicobacter didelphidarum]